MNFLCADMFPCEDSKTVSVCPYPEKRNHLGFINISPTLVIDTSMERSSRVLHHGNQKIWFFFLNVEIEFWLVLKCLLFLQYRSYLSKLCINGQHGNPIIMPPHNVTGEVYCFPRRQLIFRFGRRVIYHSKGLWEYIPKSIPSVCTTILKLILCGSYFLS